MFVTAGMAAYLRHYFVPCAEFWATLRVHFCGDQQISCLDLENPRSIWQGRGAFIPQDRQAGPGPMSTTTKTTT